MKDNYITLKDKDGNKKEYRILMNIEETSNDVNYLVYTDDSINDNDHGIRICGGGRGGC